MGRYCVLEGNYINVANIDIGVPLEHTLVGYEQNTIFIILIKWSLSLTFWGNFCVDYVSFLYTEVCWHTILTFVNLFIPVIIILIIIIISNIFIIIIPAIIITGTTTLIFNLLCCFHLLTWVNFNPVWINSYIQHKVLDEVSYQLPNFYCTTVKVWKWMSNLISHLLDIRLLLRVGIEINPRQ